MEDRDLHPLEQILLAYLTDKGEVIDTQILEESDLPDEGSFRRANQWLLSRGLICETSRIVETAVELGPVGKENISAGSLPELELLRKLDSEIVDFALIQKDKTFTPARWGSALGALLKAGVIARGSDGTLNRKSGKDGDFEKLWKEVYNRIEQGKILMLEDLPEEIARLVGSRSPRRGKDRAEFILSEKVHQRLSITPEGKEALEQARSSATIGMLTKELIANGSWKDARFRRYEVDIPPARILPGRLHPYKVFLDVVRKKLLSMGFKEMRGSLAESEFWNNDALFMPQFHPARDIHDVYYLDKRVSVVAPPQDIARKVALTHENGWKTGGRGWEYTFDFNQAGKAILRSQGTSLSARCLAASPEIPGKYFSLARCFRYDQVDATHLPDFFQIEGIVLGENINFRHLLGLLKQFAIEIAGATEYKFTPGYFPFTEPSVEMHLKHSRLGWIEGGGAGLFRPEVCKPLGVEVPVIAWGLGLDRMAMLALGIDDIRDLISSDLSRLRKMIQKPDQLLSGEDQVHA